jgi:hypothetical protein
MLFADAPSSTPRFLVEPGSLFVVRCYYLSAADDLVCIDSRRLHRESALRLARRVTRADSECLDVEVVAVRHNSVRPPPDGIRRVTRLDAPHGLEVPGALGSQDPGP